jgi:hypothetical protein
MARRLITSYHTDSSGVYQLGPMPGFWIHDPLYRTFVEFGTAPSGSFLVEGKAEKSGNYNPDTGEGNWTDVGSIDPLDNTDEAKVQTSPDPQPNNWIRGIMTYTNDDPINNPLVVAIEIWADKDTFENAINLDLAKSTSSDSTDAVLDLTKPRRQV